MSLINVSKNILPCQGKSFFVPQFIYNPNDIFDRLINELIWRNDKIKMFGKVIDQPRKVAWYGEPGIEYTYSGIRMYANAWTKTLFELKQKLDDSLGTNFNSVLINLYRDGSDYMSWHSDDEKELGTNPLIASLSLGENRDFLFRLKSDKSNKIKLNLNSGSLLVMSDKTQNFWQHSVPKRKKIQNPRLNLTFRTIV